MVHTTRMASGPLREARLAAASHTSPSGRSPLWPPAKESWQRVLLNELEQLVHVGGAGQQSRPRHERRSWQLMEKARSERDAKRLRAEAASAERKLLSREIVFEVGERRSNLVRNFDGRHKSRLNDAQLAVCRAELACSRTLRGERGAAAHRHALAACELASCIGSIQRARLSGLYSSASTDWCTSLALHARLNVFIFAPGCGMKPLRGCNGSRPQRKRFG